MTTGKFPDIMHLMNGPSFPGEQPEKIFSVSEFNEYITIYLSQVGEITIEGEISELNVSQGRWLFITVKDTDASVQIFGTVGQIGNWRLLEVGMQVHVHGRPRLYQKRGSFSVSASRIEPVGEGALRKAFEKLKAQLEKEGLFEVSRKRKLPQFPNRIGLITAEGREAYGDFLKVLKGRMGGIRIHFYPVNVQGRDAVPTITRAFRYFSEHMPDLNALVLTRGGGSLEDLMAFNDEQVARAIFSSKIPVVCGVGHEYDITIADLVADVRASTPSNAAELLVRDRTDVERYVDGMVRRLEFAIDDLVRMQQQQISGYVDRLERMMDSQTDRIKILFRRLSQAYQSSNHNRELLTERTASLSARLTPATYHWLDTHSDRLVALARILNGFDYRNILKQGYSITRNAEGKLVKSVHDIPGNTELATTVQDGTIKSLVITSIK